jgi:hypothetical protein
MERLSSEDSILLRATIPANPNDVLHLCCYQIKILNNLLFIISSYQTIDHIPWNLQYNDGIDPQQFKLGLNTIYRCSSA